MPGNRPDRRARLAPARAVAGLAWLCLPALAPSGCIGQVPPARFAWSLSDLEAERRCQEGTIAACGDLGRRLTSDEIEVDGAKKNLEQGLVLLELACGQDDPSSCTALGELYGQHAKPGGALQARARDLLTRTCRRGAASACTALGDVIQGADPGSRGEASEAFRDGCQRGDAAGCEKYGLVQSGGDNDRKDLAEEAFARACTTGRRSSCHFLAMMRLNEPTTHDRGAAMLGDNCQAGFARSCDVAAALFAPLLSLKPRCELALPPARQACEAQDPIGCALVRACGLPVPELRRPALEHLAASCGAGVGVACLYWADAQENPHPDDAPADPARVKRAYQQACQERSLGAQIACARIAAEELAHASSGLEADRSIANLREMCIHSSADACCVLADQYQSGKWIAADPTRSTELRRRACDLGLGRCCQPAAGAP